MGSDRYMEEQQLAYGRMADLRSAIGKVLDDFPDLDPDARAQLQDALDRTCTKY